jgi:hypothetical protein
MALPGPASLPDHLGNHLIWVVSIKVIPLGLKQNVPWACNLPTTLMTDTVIVFMELDWYCTGATGMKQQSCWGVLWFFKRPQVSPLERQRIRQRDFWCLITNTRANRVEIVSSIITRYLTLAKHRMFTIHLSVFVYVQWISFKSLFIARWYAVIRQLLFITLPVVWLTFIRFCSITSFCSIIRCSIIQCHFLFWYWNCIPGVLIPHITNHPASQQISYTRLRHFLS